MTEPRVLTFGCRLNAFESEVMRGHAQDAGLENAILVNSCAVTAEAERQACQAIRKARRENPAARIVVTGCAAQIDPARFAAMPEVDHVMGNGEKLEAKSWQALASGEAPRTAVADIMALRESAAHLIAGFGGRARVFLEVQQGCDHRCTFCIIPYGRGPSRSLPVGEIVAQARQLTESGVAELVLTGVDLTGYGQDLPGKPTLGQMARRLLKLVPDLKRLRISSVDPIEVDEDLVTLVAEEPRLMPHLHLSLQHGDDLILKRMKRRHSRADAVALTRRLRTLRPDIVFGADLIAGFPTESDAAHRASLSLIEECGLTFLHVFPYSARKGTPAARMPQLPMALRRERAAELRARGEFARAAWFAAVAGRETSLLVEKNADDAAHGHTEHFAPARLAGQATPGSIITARIAGHDSQGLILEALAQQAA
jgi:threonylcarbamoyladenosine tRNA methylthiotransferase MtaB